MAMDERKRGLAHVLFGLMDQLHMEPLIFTIGQTVLKEKILISIQLNYRLITYS